LDQVAADILTNPVTQQSSFAPLTPLGGDFDWLIWVGLRPGVKDNPGDTAKEAIENQFQRSFGEEKKVFTSQIYAFSAPALGREQVESIASELLANDLVQRWRVISASEWAAEEGVGLILPKVELGPRPTFAEIEIATDADLLRLSNERSLALHPADAPVIRAYFQDPARAAERAKVGLGAGPTDVELEFISQARSDHCNHNTFGGLFDYRELASAESETIDSLFKTYIKDPTLALAAQKDWVVSVLWDNAGVAAFDEDWLYTITAETHNSPSNMEAYGGALTGIVGVYRDPMGAGLGSKLILGAYGYCVGPRDYAGPLKPRLHPRRLLDGVIEGVKDGGNASGVPTGFGLVLFDEGYLGKCLVYVTALGIMPRQAGGKKTWLKKPNPGDLIVMAGGRVGVDGIHGVTASSEGYSDKTPAGHVQIGDPYTQKKMADFLIEVRDEGLMTFLTDNGGGGLSSSVGESARMSGLAGGAEVWLDKVPLKYPGLQLWEIWVSESQERMTAAVPPEKKDRFFELAAKHAVEATIIGRYTDTGKLHLTSDGTTCAYLEVDFTQKGFPQWRFSAEWTSPGARGLTEPVLSEPSDQARLLSELLASPNLAAKNWITRQYDHEVQGGAVIKPLIGLGRDVPADAVVYRPVLTSERGLCLTQCLNPSYGRIDTFHMTTATIDEAVRRLLAVGADLFRIGAVDNFCWPNIQFDPATNPDGKYKAAQLVRSCQALAEVCQTYGIPLLSGKDSMYVDGMLAGPFGERRKVSGLPTLQITATSIIDTAAQATTPEPKAAGDFVY
ncbi:MAG: phosphoribosylformylglycinamidine synthase, partial [Deltaproteobacteria bacterium]|nr:phosphoribosylformylglycinamidine synthase [Deltaproteobacteria bacterium]